MSRPCNDLVTVIEGNVDFALKLQKKRLATGGVFLEMRRRDCAKSPGVRRREKRAPGPAQATGACGAVGRARRSEREVIAYSC